ncbi:hypothetical protein D3C86_2177820 [compost metagenome]
MKNAVHAPSCLGKAVGIAQIPDGCLRRSLRAGGGGARLVTHERPDHDLASQ